MLHVGCSPREEHPIPGAEPSVPGKEHIKQLLPRDELLGAGEESHPRRMEDQPERLWNIPTPSRFSSRSRPPLFAHLCCSPSHGRISGKRVPAGWAPSAFSFSTNLLLGKGLDSTAGTPSTQREGWWPRRAALPVPCQASTNIRNERSGYYRF